MQNNKSALKIKTLDLNHKEFFTRWLEFLKPYHGLRHKEIELLSLFLYKRYELQKVIKDEEILIKVLFDTSNRVKIKQEIGYTSLQVLSNVLSSLRTKGVLDSNNNIHPGLIPQLNGDNFKLVFNFNLKDDNR